MKFEEAFRALTGYDPMRWQARVYQEHFANGDLPSAVSIPTGLGKTAVMAVWLTALAEQLKGGGKPKLPRRLVYVVDRRAVVDQATHFAETLRENLGKANGLVAALGLGENESLPISTLRGQFVDNREWLNDPAKPAIIVGTVDMIGSRMLFEGYGVGRKMRPYQAGLLGADALVVLDEAHLVPPFEALLAEIAGNGERYGAKDEESRALVPKFRLLPLSATGRRATAQPFVLERKDFYDPEDDLVIQRLFAKKHLKLEELDDRKLEDALAEGAWSISDEGKESIRVIVYCNSRDVAEKVKTALDKKTKGTSAQGRTELFVGARRVKERVDAEERLRDLGFLAGSGEQTAPAFLVATSAGEVGVDLDADHMVCDLVAWERVVQRFGRVNRRGGTDRQAEIVIIHSPPKEPETKKPDDLVLEEVAEPKFELEEPIDPGKPGRKPGKNATDAERAAYETKKEQHDNFKNALVQYKSAKKKFDGERKIYEKAKKEQEGKRLEYAEALAAYKKDWEETFLYQKRLSLLEELQGNASPDALRNLAANAELSTLIEECNTPIPLRPALSRALVDAWAMTSLPEHTGRPEVAPWLRGWVDDLSQTTVVWRKHLPVRSQPAVGKKELEVFFEAAPVHASETLETETSRVMNWLKARAEKLGKAKDDEKLFERDAVIGMLLRQDGQLARVMELGHLLGATKEDKERHKDIERDLTGKTLVMDARFAGLQDGLLNDAAADAPETADSEGSEWIASDDAKPIIRFRIQASSEDEAMEGDEWRESLRFDLERSKDGEAMRWLSIQKWRDASNSENDRAVGRSQTLAEHQTWATMRASTIGERLALPDEYRNMLCIAARLHDEGKKAVRWQRAFRAERDAKKFGIEGPLAKTRGPINQALLDGYRHEFGSLRLAKEDVEFKKLPEELQDLALHVIAAHHGYARPLIATSGCDDAPPSMLDERAREVALRYARLQERWGPWGLAWWESLLRAADVQASRANDQMSTRNG